MDRFLIELLSEACDTQYIQDNPDAVLDLMVEAIAEINRLKGICESYAFQYGTVTDKEYFIRRAKIEAVKVVTSDIDAVTDIPRGDEAIADHLLANGVIVPPVKVGQTVYVVNSLWVSEYTVEAVWWDGLMFQFKAENEEYADECSVFYFFDERIGKTVFLSREEAEKALKGVE